MGRRATGTRSARRVETSPAAGTTATTSSRPLGAPILAVADGTVFSVGWNEIGGWRLWLRDSGGNEFYYAHLSAYTSLAVNGRHVTAGQVLGFVGNTGDAQGTPFHLHFEVHPVSMLFLGYDGAVDPTKYLDAWKRLEDIRILPAVPLYATQSQAERRPAPRPPARSCWSRATSRPRAASIPGRSAARCDAPVASREPRQLDRPAADAAAGARPSLA